MKIQVSGHHLNVGEALRSHVESKLQNCVKKYFENPINAHVTLEKERDHLIKTYIVVNEGTGSNLVIKSEAHDADAYRSFDIAIEKAERQLSKHKDRIKHHQKHQKDRMAHIEAKKVVMSPFEDETSGDAPAIIAEMVTSIQKMPLTDAVMQMDLEDLPTLVFINAATDRLNVLYYRKDGNIAWMDIPQYNK